MKLKDRVVIVTGAARGIGAALCQAFVEAGARVCGADTMDISHASCDLAVRCDVSCEEEIQRLVSSCEQRLGEIDLFFSNAGIAFGHGEHVAANRNEDWDRIWKINVLAHIWAARALLPKMLARGEGYLASTASAAGLLSQIGSSPYAVTKAAAVAFAESLAIEHGPRGIGVSVLCPQAVRTEMIKGSEAAVAGVDGILEPEHVARLSVEAIRERRFLILPHATVQDYRQRKAADTERWIKGMQRLASSFDDK